VARPLFFADPADPALRDEDHAFLLGGDVLVQPQLSRDGSHDFPMPKGAWRTFLVAGEDPSSDRAHPVLRLRDGAILPLGGGGQTAEEAFSGPLTLVVSLDGFGRAEGRLYEDAGDGFGYREGHYLLTRYEAVLLGGLVEVRIGRQEGRWPRPSRELHIEVLTSAGILRASGGDGERISIPVAGGPA
jgi:alpha-glucosidase